MENNDIRAVILAYDWIRSAMRASGAKEIAMEDLVKAISEVLEKYPEKVYRGPDLNFTIRP